MLGRFKNIDIRSQGSGNAGGTNALRTQGFKFALGVILIDVGKAIFVVTFLPYLFVKLGLLDNAIDQRVILFAAAAVVIGHCYPIWHGFNGGKGAATLIGVLLALSPVIVMYLLLVFFTLLILTGYVGPNTVVAALSAPLIYALRTTEFLKQDMFWFLLIMGIFLMFTHRSNLKKLMQGNESRFEKARLLHRLIKKK